MGIDTATPQDWDKAFAAVTRPAHYNNGQVEAIEYIKQQLCETGILDYYEGSVLKYLHRWKYKTNPIEDLKKARWYLDRLIEAVEEE